MLVSDILQTYPHLFFIIQITDFPSTNGKLPGDKNYLNAQNQQFNFLASFEHYKCRTNLK